MSVCREALIRNIHVGLRGLNNGMGRWENVRKGLEKMDMEELVELNQLVLSIQSTQNAREKAAYGPPHYGYHFGR